VQRGQIHHIELWVPRLAEATVSIGWLLEDLGYELFQCWENGRSWKMGDTYIVVEQSPALSGTIHDRLAPGLNHLAFQAGSTEKVDELVRKSLGHGWTLLFNEAHPYAGGPEHYAAYLSNVDGFEIELVALDPPPI
jgi:catechol 2,3-dioxygenase-like lactoylglutathione lyase family enzyme